MGKLLSLKLITGVSFSGHTGILLVAGGWRSPGPWFYRETGTALARIQQ